MKKELPTKREIIPPAGGWEADTLYLVQVSYQATNPVHEAYLKVGFLHEDGKPAAYSEIWSNLYDSACPFDHAYFLRAGKILHTHDQP